MLKRKDPTTDRVVALEGVAALRRLGLDNVADIVTACLYRHALLTVGSDCTEKQWKSVLNSISPLSEAARLHLFERVQRETAAVVSLPAGYEDQALTPWEQKQTPLQITRPRSRSPLGCLQLCVTAFLHIAEKIEQSHQEYLHGKEQFRLYNLIRLRRHGVEPPVDCSTYREPMSEKLTFECLAPRFYRRLCCYAHQYLETDEDNNLIPASVYHIRFNTTGTSFVTAADDGLLKVWDASSGKLCYSLRRHFHDISDLDLCYDDQHAASCCSGKELRVWSLGAMDWSPLEAVLLPGHPIFVRFLPPFPDTGNKPSPKFLLSICEDEVIRLFDIAKFRPVQLPTVSWSFSQPTVFDSQPVSLSDQPSIPQLAFDGLHTSTDQSGVTGQPDVVALTESNDSRLIHSIKLNNNMVPRTFDISHKMIVLKQMTEHHEDDVRVDGDTTGSRIHCIYYGMGLESVNHQQPLGIESQQKQTSEESSDGSLAVCRLTIRFDSNDQPHIDQHLIYLSPPSPSESIRDPPDVAFAFRSPRLLSAGNSHSLYIWNFRNWFSSLPLGVDNNPLRLITRIKEKMDSDEYKVYQHPLARQSNTSVDTPGVDPQTLRVFDQFVTNVTALTWADNDHAVVVGCSISRRTERNKNPEKCITRETEIAVFDADLGHRLISIVDHQHLKSNISFLRPNPVVSSLVIAGTFSGQILLLDIRSDALFDYLSLSSTASQLLRLKGPAKQLQGSQPTHTELSGFPTALNFDTRCIESILPFMNGRIQSRYSPVIKVLHFGNKPVFLDTQWSSDGATFVVSQRDGCISIFTANGCSSYDEVSRLADPYTATPNHQFFDNDFRVLQNGPGGSIICPFTGIPPHRLSRGPLVDGHRFPLDRQDLPVYAARFTAEPMSGSIKWVPLNRDGNTDDGQTRKDLGVLIAEENRRRSDIHGNVLVSIEYSPPNRRRSRARQQQEQAGETPIRRRLQRPLVRASLPFAPRYGTLFSSLVDESDSSWESSQDETEVPNAAEHRLDINRASSTTSLESSSTSLVSEHSSSDQSDNGPSRSMAVNTEFAQPQRRSRTSNRRSVPGPETSSSRRSNRLVVDSNTVADISRIRGRRNSNSEPLDQQQQSSDPIGLYWRFWTVRADALSQLKDAITRTPYRRLDSTDPLDDDLLIALENTSQQDIKIEGIPEGRIKFINAIDSILTVMKWKQINRKTSVDSEPEHKLLFHAFFSQHPRRLEPIPSDERQLLLERFISVARSHRLEQRRLRRGDPILTATVHEQLDGEIPPQQQSETAAVVTRKRQRRAATEDRTCVDVGHPAARNASFRQRASRVVSDETQESETDEYQTCRLLLNGTRTSSGDFSAEPRLKRRRLSEITVEDGQCLSHMTSWMSSYTQEFRLTNGDFNNDDDELLTVDHGPFNPFRRLCSVDVLEAQVKSSFPSSSSRNANIESTIPLDNSSRSSLVVKLLSFQLLSLFARIHVDHIYNRPNNCLGPPTECAPSMNSLLQLFTQFPFSILNSAASCQPFASTLSDVRAPPLSPLLLPFELHCSVCQMTGSPFVRGPVNPLIFSLLSEDIPQQTKSQVRSDNVYARDTYNFSDGVMRILKHISEFSKSASSSGGAKKPFSLRSNSSSDNHSDEPSREELGELLKSHRQSIPGIHPHLQQMLTTTDNKNYGDHQLLGPFILPSSDPVWVHHYCFLLSFCRVDDDNNILFPNSKFFTSKFHETRKDRSDEHPKHKLKQSPRPTTITTDCSYCKQSGAVVDCEKCHQYFHYYPCSQYCWRDKKKSEYINTENPVIPDPITWPKYICPSPACLKTLRRKQSLLTGELFATPPGVRSRDWLLCVDRHKGDYVPQLGDVVRFNVRDLISKSMLCAPSVYSPHYYWFPPDALVLDIDYKFPGLRSIGGLASSSTTVSFVRGQTPSDSFHIIAVVSILILPPHPMSGTILSIPYTPGDRQPFVLLSEVRLGLERLQKFRIGDRVKLFIDNEFHIGTISDIRSTNNSVGCNAKCKDSDEVTRGGKIKGDHTAVAECSHEESKGGDTTVENDENMGKSIQYECSTFRIWDYVKNIADESNANSTTKELWKTAITTDSTHINDNGANTISLSWRDTNDDHQQQRRRKSKSSHTEEYFSKRPRIDSSESSKSMDLLEKPSYYHCWEIFGEFVDMPSGAGGNESIDLSRRQYLIEAINNVMTMRESSSIRFPMALRHSSSDSCPTAPPEFQIFSEPIPEPSVSQSASGADWSRDYWSEIELPMSLNVINSRLLNNDINENTEKARKLISTVVELLKEGADANHRSVASPSISIRRRRRKCELLEENETRKPKEEYEEEEANIKRRLRRTRQEIVTGHATAACLGSNSDDEQHEERGGGDQSLSNLSGRQQLQPRERNQPKKYATRQRSGAAFTRSYYQGR